MVYEYPDEVALAHAAAHRTALDKLAQIERIVGGASWQERACDPTTFARFCAEIDRVIDIDNSVGPLDEYRGQ
jgi:hypothetical protein